MSYGAHYVYALGECCVGISVNTCHKRSGGCEDFSSPTQGERNGKARLAIVYPDGIDDIVEMEGHIVGLSTYRSGTDFTYYWGYDWDKVSGMTEDEWKEYLSAFASESP